MPVFSKGYDISVGGGYRFGIHYAVDYLTGLHQQIIVPVSFSYDIYTFFSIGVCNKIGYGFTFYDSNKDITQANANISIKFNTFATEHEIYDKLSFVMKIGRNPKFVIGAGSAFKYSFLEIPDGSFSISVNAFDPDFNFILLEPKDYQYISIGPAFDFNLEVSNKAKSFSFTIGSPFEFLIPVNERVKRMQLQSKIVEAGSDEYLVLDSQYIETFYLNFSFGIEFIFCFNYHGDI